MNIVIMQGQTLLAATCIVVACSVHSAVCANPFADFFEVIQLTADYAEICYDSVRTYFAETCHDRWIHNNLTGLSNHLNKKLFGQHLALDAVTNHIQRHIQSAEPARALVLSFHGSIGTGKSYVSRIVAEHLYRKGMESQFVHLISMASEFPLEEKVQDFKDQLRAYIESTIADCPRSLFIFDEMNKMPPGIIDTIRPYLESYNKLRGVNYRRAIYIFLSNTAGNGIAEYAYQHWWKGYPREDIKLADVREIIIRTAISTKNELWHGELMDRRLIEFIPFLPLEKSHVMKCVKDNMATSGHKVTDEKVESIVKAISFWPKSEQVFAVFGCK
ncbi:torsin-1A-like [Haliotis rufescens]|uniref:torsin-1A-like n=1 Tax=Haliotis rufescens TaxID=6454 RepID=UPI00201F7E4C|nr:torsin-1A-like [Haliotis rufescens]